MTKRKVEYICIGCGICYPAHPTKYHYCTIQCHFWSKVDKSGDCWEWTAGGHKFGYGEFKVNGILYRAHRFSYELHKGKIPEMMGINHTCDNPKCVNPDHLYAGTQAKNMEDRSIHGKNPNRILTKDQVIEIKKLLSSGHSQTSIAKTFGVSQCTIWNIKESKTWKTIAM